MILCVNDTLVINTRLAVRAGSVVYYAVMDAPASAIGQRAITT
jgi:hypothetical protein